MARLVVRRTWARVGVLAVALAGTVGIGLTATAGDPGAPDAAPTRPVATPDRATASPTAPAATLTGAPISPTATPSAPATGGLATTRPPAPDHGSATTQAPTTSQPPATSPPQTTSPSQTTTTTSPASLSVTLCTPGGCAAKATFEPTGEHLWVCDQKPDGYGAVAQYRREDVPLQNNEAINQTGSGTCHDHNMNMAEGTKITFRVCLLASDGRRFNCSEYRTATA